MTSQPNLQHQNSEQEGKKAARQFREAPALDDQAGERLKRVLRERAVKLGFADVRFAKAEIPAQRTAAYREFVAEGRHGTMGWLAREPERRERPKGLWPEARSAVLLGFNYAPPADPLPELDERSSGYVSVYARRRDYHGVIKGRLKELAGLLARETGAEVKVFVDTAPLLEKPLAEAAGLGWQGKHTNLVSPGSGSWLFLGTILTSAEIEPDPPGRDACGSCRRCLDACPTDAFPEPYKLDARRCVSYLTIEFEGPIPHELRPGVGNRVFGCDDCLAVCPWNKFARAASDQKTALREDLKALPLAELADLGEEGFKALFASTPVRRLGWPRFLRNVLTAIGNSGDIELTEAARPHALSPDPVVAEAAAWALTRSTARPD